MDEGLKDFLRANLGDWLHDPFTSASSLLPTYQWEGHLQQTLSVSKDAVRMALALLASIAIGGGIRLIRSPAVRHLYSASTGLFLLYCVFGQAVLHALIPTALTYSTMILAPKWCGSLSWAITFPYLIWLHILSTIGDSYDAGALDFTGSEMVLVLKLISLCYAVQDSTLKPHKQAALSDFAKAHIVSKAPNPLEIVSYVFSMGNLLAGPYIEYSEYKEFIELKGVWSPLTTSSPSPVLYTLVCIANAVFFIGAHLVVGPVFSMGVLFTPWYASLPFLTRCGVQLGAGICSQFKYGFAWTLSEASLTMAGLNLSDGDGKKAPAWGRYTNIRFLKLLLTDSTAKVPLNWNILTGQFLRRYVYERLTPAGTKPGFPQLFGTQAVSALWHGVTGGQTIFFLSTAMGVRASQIIFALERSNLPSFLTKSWLWAGLKLVWTQFQINYMVLAFHILDSQKSIQAWNSVYFWPHWVCLVLVLFGSFIGGSGGRKRGEKKEGEGVNKGRSGAGGEGKERGQGKDL